MSPSQGFKGQMQQAMALVNGVACPRLKLRASVVPG